MSRKPRFKLQRLNSGDEYDRALHGNKRWINCCAGQYGGRGWRMTFEQATEEYHDIAGWYPAETYRIMEKR